MRNLRNLRNLRNWRNQGTAELAELVAELAELAAELARRPQALTLLAHAEGEAAGLLNAFEGFSTFAGRPLLNLHDVVVSRRFRGRGIGRMLLAAANALADVVTAEELNPTYIVPSVFHDGVTKAVAGAVERAAREEAGTVDTITGAISAVYADEISING